MLFVSTTKSPSLYLYFAREKLRTGFGLMLGIRLGTWLELILGIRLETGIELMLGIGLALRLRELN